MLPLALFGRRRFTIANAVAAVMNLGSLGCIYVLTLFLQVVQHRTPLEAGLAVIPLFAPVAALAPMSGRLTGRFGPRGPMLAGLLVAAAGLALLSRAGPATPYAEIVPAFLLWGSGLGLLTSGSSRRPSGRSSPSAPASPRRSTTRRARRAARLGSPRSERSRATSPGRASSTASTPPRSSPPVST
jgi:MFS transporter, DHA2 family, methylenomycin A resistance protein